MSAFNVGTACDELAAEYMRVLGMLHSLPVGGSISEGGRSISATASEIQARLNLIKQEAAGLGCPLGTLAEPFVITTRAVSGWG